MRDNSFILVLLLLFASLSSGSPLPAGSGSRQGKMEVGGMRPRNLKVARVVGGTEIEPYSWPSLIVLAVLKDNKWVQGCTGTVLDNRHILTAAHCFDGEMGPNFRHAILAGMHDITDPLGDDQFSVVASIVRHPDYEEVIGDPNHNIAVLKLARPLTMNERVKPIDLNDDPDYPPVGAICTVVGWGQTGNNDPESSVPLEVDIPIRSGNYCTAAYPYFSKTEQLCAGEEGKGSCNGDFGGPLVCNCSGTRKQVGVVSYGRRCDNGKWPAVYARVSTYAQWINETVQG